MKRSLASLMLFSTLALTGAAQENAPVHAKAAQPAIPSEAAPQAVSSDYDYRVVRLYDLSTLGAALSSPGTPPGQIERQLVSAISDSFDILVSPISNSVFVIGAGPETHTRIEALLGQIRSSTAERFKVQLVTLTLPADCVNEPVAPCWAMIMVELPPSTSTEPGPEST